MADYLTLKVEYKEIRKLSEKFQEMQDRVTSNNLSFRTSLKDKFTKILSDDVRKRFLSSPSTISGGRVYGDVYWRALSDSYLAKRPDRQRGVVLVDTGALRDSFQMESPDLISRFTNQYEWQFGSRISYGNKLQKTWPIVFFTTDVLRQLGEAYNEWLVEKFED
jgi:hypothetical protein